MINYPSISHVYYTLPRQSPFGQEALSEHTDHESFPSHLGMIEKAVEWIEEVTDCGIWTTPLYPIALVS